MSKQGTAPARTTPSVVEHLAKFFPEATPVRIPVRLTRLAPATPGSPDPQSESTVLEFGTSREVLFASSLALEFADKVRIRNSDGSLDAEATVVALQYQEGRTAVAARFVREVANWIVKP